MTNTDLKKLREPFPAAQISWRVGFHNEAKTEGQALPYIDARVVENRLDDVIGPESWRNTFVEVIVNGKLVAVRCALGIKVNGEWVEKEDAAPFDTSDSGRELALKGVYSDALKRAAVQWGVGRYLYGYKAPVVALTDDGRHLAEIPTLPDEFLPENERGQARPAPGPVQDADVRRPVTAAVVEQPRQESTPNEAREEALVDAAAQRSAKAEAPTPAQSPEPSTAPAPTTVETAQLAANDGPPMSDEDFIAAQSPEQQTYIKDLLVKIGKVQLQMLRSWVNGPKGKDKLTAASREFVLRKMDEKERAAA